MVAPMRVLWADLKRLKRLVKRIGQLCSIQSAGPGFQDDKIDLKSELKHVVYPPKTSTP